MLCCSQKSAAWKSVRRGLLNVRSLTDKLLTVLQIRRNKRLTMLCMTETWQQNGSQVCQDMQNIGFTVIRRARMDDPLDKDRGGGVAICSAPRVGLSLENVNLLLTFNTTEVVAAKMTAGRSVAIFVVIYRPNPPDAKLLFINELSALFQYMVTNYTVPIYVVGDFNVHLDDLTDNITQNMLAAIRNAQYKISKTRATHDQCHIFDAVIVHGTRTIPAVH